MNLHIVLGKLSFILVGFLGKGSVWFQSYEVIPKERCSQGAILEYCEGQPDGSILNGMDAYFEIK
jgi:hypothetical protein